MLIEFAPIIYTALRKYLSAGSLSMISYEGIKVIGFDADDTLWVNEPFFREAENTFCRLMTEYAEHDQVRQALYTTQVQNLDIYGYGVKGFVLSMMECALAHSPGQLDQNVHEKMIEIGKDMLDKPVDLLSGVESTLDCLSKKYMLILITKGDLLDQQKKVTKSGLRRFFRHIEVVSNKSAESYRSLLKRLCITIENFLMVGNSLKSDVIPPIEIGAEAVYLPFDTTWNHEKLDDVGESRFMTISSIEHLKEIL